MRAKITEMLTEDGARDALRRAGMMPTSTEAVAAEVAAAQRRSTTRRWVKLPYKAAPGWTVVVIHAPESEA